MSHKLIVSYTPRSDSNTKKILDAYTNNLPSTDTTTTVDLAADAPALLDSARVDAYVARNYMRKELTEDQKQAMAPLDFYTDQLLEADTIILAFPMYNFSMPAAVKAWFDGVTQYGKTFGKTSDGNSISLADKKVVVISTSGGRYGEGSPAAHMEHSESLIKTIFGIMGITDITTIVADGSNSPDHFPTVFETSLKLARKTAVAS